MTTQSYRGWFHHELLPSRWRVSTIMSVCCCAMLLQMSLTFSPIHNILYTSNHCKDVLCISTHSSCWKTRVFAAEDNRFASKLPPDRLFHTKKRDVKMQLLPISKNILRDIIPRRVNTEQWKSYWGTTPFEKVQKMMESVLVAYGGAWLAWFVSFMSGGPLAAIVGTALIFNWIFSPYVISRRNNQRFWFDGKGKPLHHAIFIAKIISIKRIRRRRPGRSLGGIAQEFLNIVIQDEEDKELEIICPWKDDYSKLRLEMTIQMVLASKVDSFQSIKAVSDAYIPSCNVWVGDYPYVDKKEFKLLLRQIMRSKITPASLMQEDDEDADEVEEEVFQARRNADVRSTRKRARYPVSNRSPYRLPPSRDASSSSSRENHLRSRESFDEDAFGETY